MGFIFKKKLLELVNARITVDLKMMKEIVKEYNLPVEE
jgi:hypothetical protein